MDLEVGGSLLLYIIFLEYQNLGPSVSRCMYILLEALYILKYGIKI